MYEEVSAGGSQICALRHDGYLLCVGGPVYEGPVVGGDFGNGVDRGLVEPYRSVGAHGTTTCALRHSGYVSCWGQLAATDIYLWRGAHRSFSVGGTQMCAVRSDNSISCWKTRERVPRIVPPVGDSYVDVSVGGFHACALRSDGSVVCWGDDSYGQSADPEGTFA
ncbi:MAG: hypothetical protein F4Y56_05695, partial [Acidimicrobiaceae bacterium]|nr:hypothetical protein [Acidimicrobiaceae bacterium]